jgi:hypothetical protein
MTIDDFDTYLARDKKKLTFPAGASVFDGMQLDTATPDKFIWKELGKSRRRRFDTLVVLVV